MSTSTTTQIHRRTNILFVSNYIHNFINSTFHCNYPDVGAAELPTADQATRISWWDPPRVYLFAGTNVLTKNWYSRLPWSASVIPLIADDIALSVVRSAKNSR